MKLRWYWDSRAEIWYKYKSNPEFTYTLQASLDGVVWQDVPYVLEQTEDAKPSE